MKRSIHRQVSLGVLAFGLLIINACGSSGSKAESITTTDPVAATGIQSTGSTEPATDRKCDSTQFNSIPDAVRAATAPLGDIVTSTELDDACGVAVQTSLTSSAGDAETARVVCGYAASESFGAGATTVQVFSADKVLLAKGTPDETCVVVK